jgi:hypothetical protein
MLGTYASLRAGLAVIAISLPIVVVLSGKVLHHVWIEPSLSSYYHVPSAAPFLTTRDLFVGGLFAAAACLYLYKGFSDKENVALNLAGVFAVFVAVLPTAAPKSPTGIVATLHRTSAVLFFLCIAYVSLFRSRDTFPLLDYAKQSWYARRYVATGLAMIVSPLAAVVLSSLLNPRSPFAVTIFCVETLGVWAFAAYWMYKTREMRETRGEQRALDAELEREASPKTPAAVPPKAASRSLGKILAKVVPSSSVVERIVPADKTLRTP